MAYIYTASVPCATLYCPPGSYTCQASLPFLLLLAQLFCNGGFLRLSLNFLLLLSLHFVMGPQGLHCKAKKKTAKMRFWTPAQGSHIWLGSSSRTKPTANGRTSDLFPTLGLPPQSNPNHKCNNAVRSTQLYLVIDYIKCLYTDTYTYNIYIYIHMYVCIYIYTRACVCVHPSI